MNNVLRNFFISISSSVISGIIMLFIQQTVPAGTLPNPLVLIICLLVLIVVFLTMMLWSYRSFGIRRILYSSVKGEGSTKSYMKFANQSILFMGIASSKWLVDLPMFEKTIRRICSLSSGSIRFLLLAPDSPATRDLSMAQGNRDNAVQSSIRNSLDKIKKSIVSLKAELNNEELFRRFEVRLYDQTPVYRLAILDRKRAYLSFYRIGSDGSKIRQLVIYPSNNTESDDQNIFNSLNEYFECIWSAKNTIKLDFNGDPVAPTALVTPSSSSQDHSAQNLANSGVQHLHEN